MNAHVAAPKKPLPPLKAELPEGWTLEDPRRWRDCRVLTACNGRGMVTIDYAGRYYRAGHSMLGAPAPGMSSGGHEGRHWRESLEKSAIDWLVKAMQ